jgi:hypothetical protein
MARFMRLEVINTLLDIGLVPLFYNADVETSIELASACSRGGAKVIEFTNRGELAYPVFTELVRHFAKQTQASFWVLVPSSPPFPRFILCWRKLYCRTSFVPVPAVQSPDPAYARLRHREFRRRKAWRGNCKIFQRGAWRTAFIKIAPALHRLMPTGVDCHESAS